MTRPCHYCIPLPDGRRLWCRSPWCPDRDEKTGQLSFEAAK